MTEISDEQQAELEAAHDEITAAINKYIQLHGAANDLENPFLLGYACYVEVTSTTAFNESYSSDCFAIVQKDQSTATTRGLFEFGKDAYTWVREARQSPRLG